MSVGLWRAVLFVWWGGRQGWPWWGVSEDTRLFRWGLSQGSPSGCSFGKRVLFEVGFVLRFAADKPLTVLLVIGQVGAWISKRCESDQQRRPLWVL